MNSLRQGGVSVSQSAKKGGDKESQDRMTIENPPTFYDDDLRKWGEKFAKSVKQREQFKRTYHSQEKRTIFTSNDHNCTTDPDKKLSEIKYTGGQLSAQKSEFKRVIGRRKSRQSVNAPTNCDLDFVGNTSDFSHMIKNMALDRDQINFNMNLRTYKNQTNFGAEKAFKYPPPKEFSPKAQLADLAAGMGNKNTEFK